MLHGAKLALDSLSEIFTLFTITYHVTQIVL